MIGNIYISGVIGEDVTLLDVIRQAKSFEGQEGIKELQFNIKSIGGSVDEAEKICNYMDSLKASYRITTYAEQAYSSGSVIFAKGDKRIVEDKEGVLMIHFAWISDVSGRAKDLEFYAEQLRKKEEEFKDFYAGVANIDREAIGALLDNETFLNADEAIEIGLATEKAEVKVKAVALFNMENQNQNKKQMTEEKESKGKALLKAFASFLGIEQEGQKPEIKAELTIQDSNGVELYFADLEAGATPKPGDKATADQKAVEDGVYIIPSLSVKLTFAGGEITAVDPIEEEETKPDVETETKPDPTAQVVAMSIRRVETWTVDAPNMVVVEGETLKVNGCEGVENADAGEWIMEDGTRVVTDSSGLIIKVEKKATQPAPGEVPQVDVAAQLEEIIKAGKEKVRADIKAELKEELASKDAEIKALKEKIGSKEIEIEGKAAGVQEKKKPHAKLSGAEKAQSYLKHVKF